jgi:hypothetical protein
MGEILGIGTTHYPALTGTDEGLSSFWQLIINAPLIDPKWKDRRNWPAGMLDEVGNDMGLSAARRYRERMWSNFRKQRQMIDDFKPDFIVLIADDQYENFKEDIIPPFCVYGLDRDFEQDVWGHGFNGRKRQLLERAARLEDEDPRPPRRRQIPHLRPTQSRRGDALRL